MTSIKKIGPLIALSLIPVILLTQVDPIAQDMSYFNFADQRSWLGIDNAWNVLSNLGFVLVAMFAFPLYRRYMPNTQLQTYVQVFLVGVLATAFGSAWFHWQPNNASLVWDRLPMTIAFSSFFWSILHDYISEKVRPWLWPVVIVSACTVLFWYWTETQGQGDLRPYVVVQFLPLLLLLPILFMFQGNSIKRAPVMWALVFYILAKVAEELDEAIYELTGHWISGHSLKHLIAALATYYILKAYFIPDFKPYLKSSGLTNETNKDTFNN